MCSSDIFLGLLAILFPPIAVWIKSGICTADSIINILLCTLGYIPGLLRKSKSRHWGSSDLETFMRTFGHKPTDYDFPLTSSSTTDAWYIISLYPEPSDYEYESVPHDQGENGRVTYYYVNHRPNGEGLRQQGAGLNHQYQQQPQRGYGTTEGMTNPPKQQRAEGSSQGGVPPSYEQAVSGDHKVQT